MSQTLAEYVTGLTNNPEVGYNQWYPKGWIRSKGGPVHVQAPPDQLEDKLVALCGDEHDDSVLLTSNAVVLLRRTDGCKNCEKAVPDD